MRGLSTFVFGILAILAAIGAGVGVVLVRNVVEPQGFARTVVEIVQSPAGQRLVADGVSDGLVARSGELPVPVGEAAADAIGRWAAQIVAGDQAARILAPTAIALHRGLLVDRQSGTAALDLRAFASAGGLPPDVEAVLLAAPGGFVVEVPWVRVSGTGQFIIRQLDRHRTIPSVLAGGAVLFALISLFAARRRGLAMMTLGVGLIASVMLLHLYVIRDPALWFPAGGESARGLDVAAVDAALRGWNAVGGALVVIGVAIIIVGAVVGIGSRAQAGGGAR